MSVTVPNGAVKTVTIAEGAVLVLQQTFAVSGRVNLEGQGSGATLSGDSLRRLIALADGGEINATRITFTQGSAGGADASPRSATARSINGVDEDEDGGCLVIGSYAKFRAFSSAFTDCEAGGSGGALSLLPFASFYAEDSSFSGNSAAAGTGGVVSMPAQVTAEFNNCEVRDSGAIFGGALSIDTGGKLTISECTFSNCSTLEAPTGVLAVGGCLHADRESQLEIRSCHFRDCTSPKGGGIYTRTSALTIHNSSFTNCKATAPQLVGNIEGGALSIYGARVEFDHCTFTECQGYSGGAVRLAGASAGFENCRFDRCEALSQGGAIYVVSSTMYMYQSSATRCQAAKGGFLYTSTLTSDWETFVELWEITVEGCTAIVQGGALCTANDRSLIMISICVFTNNWAPSGAFLALLGTEDAFELIETNIAHLCDSDSSGSNSVFFVSHQPETFIVAGLELTSEGCAADYEPLEVADGVDLASVLSQCGTVQRVYNLVQSSQGLQLSSMSLCHETATCEDSGVTLGNFSVPRCLCSPPAYVATTQETQPYEHPLFAPYAYDKADAGCTTNLTGTEIKVVSTSALFQFTKSDTAFDHEYRNLTYILAGNSVDLSRSGLYSWSATVSACFSSDSDSTGYAEWVTLERSFGLVPLQAGEAIPSELTIPIHGSSEKLADSESVECTVTVTLDLNGAPYVEAVQVVGIVSSVLVAASTSHFTVDVLHVALGSTTHVALDVNDINGLSVNHDIQYESTSTSQQTRSIGVDLYDDDNLVVSFGGDSISYIHESYTFELSMPPSYGNYSLRGFVCSGTSCTIGGDGQKAFFSSDVALSHSCYSVIGLFTCNSQSTAVTNTAESNGILISIMLPLMVLSAAHLLWRACELRRQRSDIPATRLRQALQRVELEELRRSKSWADQSVRRAVHRLRLCARASLAFSLLGFPWLPAKMVVTLCTGIARIDLNAEAPLALLRSAMTQRCHKLKWAICICYAFLLVQLVPMWQVRHSFDEDTEMLLTTEGLLFFLICTHHIDSTRDALNHAVFYSQLISVAQGLCGMAMCCLCLLHMHLMGSDWHVVYAIRNWHRASRIAAGAAIGFIFFAPMAVASAYAMDMGGGVATNDEGTSSVVIGVACLITLWAGYILAISLEDGWEGGGLMGALADANGARGVKLEAHEKFGGGACDLISGQPKEAATGIFEFMQVDEMEIRTRMQEGVAAIVREFAEHGTETDRESLNYVLYAEAGSSDARFHNGWARDMGRPGGLYLKNFVEHPQARAAKLMEAHVVAMRLYTTAAYHSLNAPLRDVVGRDPPRLKRPHPLPVTITFLYEGLKRMRAANEEASDNPSEAGHQRMHKLKRRMRKGWLESSFVNRNAAKVMPQRADGGSANGGSANSLSANGVSADGASADGVSVKAFADGAHARVNAPSADGAAAGADSTGKPPPGGDAPGEGAAERTAALAAAGFEAPKEGTLSEALEQIHQDSIRQDSNRQDSIPSIDTSSEPEMEVADRSEASADAGGEAGGEAGGGALGGAGHLRSDAKDGAGADATAEASADASDYVGAAARRKARISYAEAEADAITEIRREARRSAVISEISEERESRAPTLTKPQSNGSMIKAYMRERGSGEVAVGFEERLLWRGMRDLKLTHGFLNLGGAELACMSTTSDIDIAVKYTRGATHGALIFMLRIYGFMSLGADLRFLSAFPQEEEFLYPPLTYLRPLGQVHTFKHADGQRYTLIEVEPIFPT